MPDMWTISCLLFVVSISFAGIVSGEVFTAMADVEELLESEKEVVETLEAYLFAEEIRLEKIRRFTNEFKDLYAKASNDLESFISHPVNTYLFVKRLTSDWKEAEDVLNQQLGREYLEIIYKMRSNMPFPTDEDLTGVAIALSRLQDTYRIDSDHIAKGKIKGVSKSPQLSPSECFELGRVLYNFKDYDHSIDWMKTTLHRFDETPAVITADNGTIGVTRADAFEYLAFSNYMKGNVREALKFTNLLLAYEPTHERAQNNVAYYEKEIAAASQGRKRGDDGDTAMARKGTIELRPDSWENEKRTYQMLCRGEKQANASVARHLNCYYESSHPFLKIQPIKTELLHLDPKIVMFHEVASDKEIATIKTLAGPRLMRATVQNSLTGELETAHYRISKSAWLNSKDDRVVELINQRIGMLTGLDMDYAEELQIANYGIGGHYEPHFDFARKAESKAFTSLGMGNRVATFLLYMTDVEAGGGTVFPRLNLSLWPKKGSAAFWYNLYKNGEGDLRTRHAACPVLSGVKWVSNKWIHEYGQEARRPCGLQSDGFEPDEIDTDS
ncbi:Prolyl 4-hydroxylase subunit alpha-2 [Hypsibius exemplaris]|uniref:procollagen-proline 4-dioxygenase n=1 Tax=Hypsibius exemplaris TaxID=2072580 RepID=A0A1W0WLB4_HYPEX|nr:Prolyl 4-hydroxylase subunit alpha-2 [Hypsibius exemplaris]